MGAVRGRKRTPRVLVAVSDDQLANGVEKMFETVRPLAELNDLSTLRQAEWDVLVTDRKVLEDADEEWSVEPHLFVLMLGWGPHGELGGVPSSLAPLEPASQTDEPVSVAAYRHAVLESPRQCEAVPTVAEELRTPEIDDPQLTDLVERTLVPLSESREEKFGLGFYVPTPLVGRSKVDPPDHFTAFLETTEPVALAGRFTRDRQEGSECWVLPEGVEEPLEWLRVAVQRWKVIAPGRFECLPGWERTRAWLTVQEQSTEDDLATHDQKRGQILEQLDAERNALEKQRSSAQKAADAGARRLLTAKGDELVDAARDALKELGFQVDDVDARRGKGDRLHDLEVTDPAQTKWIAIVEVKGHTRAAKVNDLLHFERYRGRFRDAHGYWADACWYVVNQHVGQDPGGRPRVLHANPDELSAFASSGGLAVDTAALFALLRSVELGEVQPAEARQQLRTTTGVFEWPPIDEG